jgi:3-oxoadipate enol-lactonase
MSILQPGPQQIAYRLDGPADAPVLVLSNSLGTTMAMWDAQAAALARTFRVLRYDTRGHGGSGQNDTSSGYTLDQLGNDVLRLLDGLGIEHASFCGISMGGLTGLWLGVHAGHRLERLVVANSAARIGTAAGWNERAAHVATSGMDAVADGARGRWFTEAFAHRAPAVVDGLVDGLRRTPPAGYAACCRADAARRGSVRSRHDRGRRHVHARTDPRRPLREAGRIPPVERRGGAGVHRSVARLLCLTVRGAGRRTDPTAVSATRSKDRTVGTLDWSGKFNPRRAGRIVIAFPCAAPVDCPTGIAD